MPKNKKKNSPKKKVSKFTLSSLVPKKRASIIAVFVVLFGLVGAFTIFSSFAESVSAKVQGEWLKGSGEIIWDKNAEYSQALKLSSNTPAGGTVTTTGPSTVIKIKARANYCRTAPQLNITIDGKSVLYANIYSGNFIDYSAKVAIPQGQHSVSATFVNPNWRSGKCGMRVFIDSITLVDTSAPNPAASDTTAPKVSLTAPAANATLKEGALITAAASDNIAVSKVEFYAANQNGGKPLSSVSATPYSYTWDTTSVPNGSYSLFAKAYDLAGNVATSSFVSVNINNPSTTTPTPTPTPPPPTSSAPSGQAMPIGDLPGWRQIFTDDFTTNVAVGGFSNCSTSSYSCSGLPSSVAAKWWAYPDGWKDTSKNGTYYPSKVLSINGGVLNMNIHSENGVHMVAAPVPKAVSSVNGQLYGRYAVRFKADAVPGYKTAWLLWPDSYTWPRDGEIDFPEGDLTGGINAFMHKQGATSGSDQAAFSTGANFSTWHTAVIEWSPGKCTFILDGRIIGTATDRVPNTAMHWVLQTETALSSTAPNDSAAGNVQIDWVAVWAKQ